MDRRLEAVMREAADELQQARARIAELYGALKRARDVIACQISSPDADYISEECWRKLLADADAALSGMDGA